MNGLWCIFMVMMWFVITPVTGQAEKAAAAGTSDSATDLFLGWQEDLKTNNFESAWLKTTWGFRQQFKNDIDGFKRSFADTGRAQKIVNLRVSGEVVIDSKKKAVLVADASDMPQNAFYIFEEQGRWKIGPNVKALLERVDNDLDRLSQAIREFYRKEQRFPRSLSELQSGYIMKVPPDLFGFTEYFYGLKPYGAVLYSAGPDCTDNLGEIEYFPERGILSPGDIIIRINR